MARQLVVRFTDDDWRTLQEIKRQAGLTHDSEAVRYALKKAVELIALEKRVKNEAVAKATSR